MSSEISSPELLAPHEIIFSCAICQRTISELYKRPQTDHGFSSGGHEERVVTRVPFYPQGKQPSAPCPYCVDEKKDSTPRLLYFITGRGRDEYDKNIPAEYFQIPPSDLSADSTSASALRFQYLSLLRFSGMMAKRQQEAALAAEVAEAKVQDLTTSLRDTGKETADLRLQIDELRIVEKKYEALKKRGPEIRHHLGNVTALTNENTQMRRQLKQLGCEIPRTTYSIYREDGGVPKPTTTENADVNASFRMDEHDSSSSGKKRSREVFLEDTADEPNGNHFQAYDSMPPPPKPRHQHQKQAVHVNSGGAWRTAHSSNTGFARPVQVPQPAQKQYTMNDTLRSQQSQMNGLTPRLWYRPQDVGSDELESSLAWPLRQRSRAEQNDPNHNEPYYDATVNQQVPSRNDNGNLSTHQPLGFAPESDHLHRRQSSFDRVEDIHITRRRLLSRDQRTHASTEPLGHDRSRTTSSPFFYDTVQASIKPFQPQMVARSILPPQADQLLPDLDGMRMDVDVESPSKTHSLNDLSFIQQPYTQSNKPIYSRPASRMIWSRAAPNVQEQQYTMPAVPNRSYLLDPRVAPRATIAPPPAPASRQIQGGNPGLQHEGGFQRFAKRSSLAAPTHNASSNSTRFPFQQRSGLNTGNALRSVRR